MTNLVTFVSFKDLSRILFDYDLLNNLCIKVRYGSFLKGTLAPMFYDFLTPNYHVISITLFFGCVFFCYPIATLHMAWGRLDSLFLTLDY